MAKQHTQTEEIARCSNEHCWLAERSKDPHSYCQRMLCEGSGGRQYGPLGFRWSFLELGNSGMILYLKEKIRWHHRRTLSSTPLEGTPKSQPTAEQPSIKTDWNLPKIFYFQRQRISHKTAGREHLQSNQIPFPLGRQPTNWRTLILWKLSNRSENSEPCVRLPRLGVRHGEEALRVSVI